MGMRTRQTMYHEPDGQCFVWAKINGMSEFLEMLDNLVFAAREQYSKVIAGNFNNWVLD